MDMFKLQVDSMQKEFDESLTAVKAFKKEVLNKMKNNNQSPLKKLKINNQSSSEESGDSGDS